MSQSDKSLAFATGASTGTFRIADRKFQQRALFIREVNEYLAVDDKEAFVIARLNDRLADKGEPIDADWLEGHVTYAEFSAIVNLLISGGVGNPNG